MNISKRTLILGAVGAALATSAVFTFAAGSVDRSLPEMDLEDANLALVEDMALGNESAPVTLIEYASFTCPHCANFATTVFPRLKADYIDTGKIRYVHHEVFFDRFGLWAAMIARCDGAASYFPVAKLIYEKQAEWTSKGSTQGVVDGLRDIASIAGLSASDVDRCLEDEKMAQSLVATFERNKAQHGIASTPSFVIGGKTHRNMSYDDLSGLIEGELEKLSRT